MNSTANIMANTADVVERLRLMSNAERLEVIAAAARLMREDLLRQQTAETASPSMGGEDDAGAAWASGIASEWSADLADERQDIYSFTDGEPINDSR